MHPLLVGAAKASINPTPDMYPIPNKMSDFDLEPMSQEASYDEMNCRAIAIDTGIARLLFLTFELAGAPDFPNYPAEVSRKTASLSWVRTTILRPVTGRIRQIPRS